MEIKNEIINYINTNEMCGALLITGDWGSGKSFLVKKIAEELNNGKSCSIAHISLFGVDDIGMLNNLVKNEYFEMSLQKSVNNIQKISKKISEVVNKGIEVTTEICDRKSISGIGKGISSILSINPLDFIKVSNKTIGKKGRKFVLIFDDFERSKLEKTELLGIINEYCENRQIKTIIIADEDKIKDEEYNEFKEKVIFKTMYFSPNFEESIESIIEEYNETEIGYKEFIYKHKYSFFSAFLHSDYSNLRSFISSLVYFERIFKVWKKSGVSQEKIGHVIYSFSSVLYEYKANNFRQNEYGDYTLCAKECKEKEGEKFSDYYIRLSSANNKIKEKYEPNAFEIKLNSVLKYIAEGLLDEEKFVSELHINYGRNNLSSYEKLLINTIWDLSYEELAESFPIMVKEVYEGRLSFNYVFKLLEMTHILRENHIPLPCDVDYAEILIGVKKRKLKLLSGELLEEYFGTISSIGNIDEEAISICEAINEIDEEIPCYKNRQMFVDFLNNKVLQSSYYFKYKSIGSFDKDMMNLFYEKYVKANNYDKRRFSAAIIGLYFKKDDKESLENIIKLSKKIRGYNENEIDLITKGINKSLLDKLEREVIPKFIITIES